MGGWIDPQGFAKGQFEGSDTEWATEMPNLALPALPAHKKPAMKRPASEVSQAGTATFRVEEYSKLGKSAIRKSKGDRRQLMSFGKAGMDRSGLESIAQQACAMLNAGTSEEEAVMWIKTQLA